MTEGNFPATWKNVCESSNFFLFFPIPLMVMCWKWFVQKKVSAVEVALALFIIIILLWQIHGFPKPVAAFSLFDRVPENRTLLSLGIASIVWTCFSLHQIIKEKTLFSWTFRIIIAVIMLTGVLLHSLYFNAATNNFASTYQIITVCLFVTVACLLFVIRKPLLFAGLILLPNIYFHALINPVCIGLKPILSNPLYEDINRTAHQEPDSKWIVYDDSGYAHVANFAYAAGANVFNGLKYVPHLEEMKEISTNNNDFKIYNRYGFIAVLSAQGSDVIFDLSPLTPDEYRIYADPGNDCWKRIGMNHRLFVTDKGIYYEKF